MHNWHSLCPLKSFNIWFYLQIVTYHSSKGISNWICLLSWIISLRFSRSNFTISSQSTICSQSVTFDYSLTRVQDWKVHVSFTQRAVPKRKYTPLDDSLFACLGHSTPLPSEGGAGGGSLGPPNAKRVPTAQGLGNPRLLKGGGYLLSRIALQYHRRRRA